MKISVVNSSLGPSPEPFQQPREIVRALNAVKLQKVFSTPYVSSMELIDSCLSVSRHPSNVNKIYSSDASGNVYLTDISTQTKITCKLHSGFANQLAPIPNSQKAFSCSNDKSIKLWDPSTNTVLSTIIHKLPISSIHHHANQNLFATCSDVVSIWDHSKTIPISTFSWGTETINKVKFNLVDTSILASLGSDRSITLIDIRTQTPVSKSILSMRCNDLSWNPREPLNFVVANEDHQAYGYDMRNLSNSTNVYKDHVSAVMSIDFSPTGNSFVTGSYDRTIRLFDIHHGRSKQMYHTKRMQRVFSVSYTSDAQYVISGSDEGNMRVWKSDPTRKLGYNSAKYLENVNYSKALVKKYGHIEEIKRIERSSHNPKSIKKAHYKQHVHLVSEKRKQQNRIKHSDQVVIKPERKKHILAVEK